MPLRLCLIIRAVEEMDGLTVRSFSLSVYLSVFFAYWDEAFKCLHADDDGAEDVIIHNETDNDVKPLNGLLI